MNELNLTYAGAAYLDRTRALLDGTVRPDGLRLQFTPMRPDLLFRRLVRATEFDVAEMSTSTYLHLLAHGDDRWLALPVFLSRNFRHGYLFVPGTSDVTHPAQLKGRRAGILEYQMTAALWQRALLQHDYGVLPTDLHWFEGNLRAPGPHDPNPVPPPPGITVEHLRDDQYLEGMLAHGEIDVLFTATRPAPFRDGSGRVRRLFPDFVAVEQDYYRRTGLFPIMHLLVVRRALYQEHPWIARRLLDAFSEAQRLDWERLQDTGTLAVMLPWLPAMLEQTIAVMGEQPWPYGYAANRAVLDAMCQYSYEQGLAPRRLQPEELFPPEVRAE